MPAGAVMLEWGCHKCLCHGSRAGQAGPSVDHDLGLLLCIWRAVAFRASSAQLLGRISPCSLTALPCREQTHPGSTGSALSGYWQEHSVSHLSPLPLCRGLELQGQARPAPVVRKVGMLMSCSTPAMQVAVLMTTMATAVPETVSSPSAIFTFLFPPGFPFCAFLYHFLAIFFPLQLLLCPHPLCFLSLDGSPWLKGA